MACASSGIEQPQVGGKQAALDDRPHALRPLGEAGEAHGPCGAVRRPRLHAHPRLGDDAERALAAQQQPVRRRARRRCPGRRREAHVPRRGDRAHRLDDVVDVGQARGEVPARARGHPPAERRELEGLRVEAQREPVLGELRLEPRAAGPRPDPRRPRDRVDLVQRVECPEVERHGPGEARGDARLDAADDARPAAVGHDRRAGGRGPGEDLLDLALVGRPRDEVGHVLEGAAQRPDDVEVGLAVRVGRAHGVVGRPQPGATARHRQAWRRQRDAGDRDGVLDVGRPEAERRDDAGRRLPGLGRGEGRVREPPPPAAALTGRGRRHGADPRPRRPRAPGRPALAAGGAACAVLEAEAGDALVARRVVRGEHQAVAVLHDLQARAEDDAPRPAPHGLARGTFGRCGT